MTVAAASSPPSSTRPLTPYSRPAGDLTGGKSRQGRYHTRKGFAATEELGLVAPEVADATLGFSDCTMPDETAERLKSKRRRRQGPSRPPEDLRRPARTTRRTSVMTSTHETIAHITTITTAPTARSDGQRQPQPSTTSGTTSPASTPRPPPELGELPVTPEVALQDPRATDDEPGVGLGQDPSCLADVVRNSWSTVRLYRIDKGTPG